MDLFTRITKKNYTDRGYGAGGPHADEMMEKEMPYPNGGYLGPGYVIGGAVALIIVFGVLGWGLWVYFR